MNTSAGWLPLAQSWSMMQDATALASKLRGIFHHETQTCDCCQAIDRKRDLVDERPGETLAHVRRDSHKIWHIADHRGSRERAGRPQCEIGRNTRRIDRRAIQQPA